MPTILAVVSDTHINSTVGLSLPRLELDDGGDYRASKTQRWLYDCWTDYWDEVEKCSQGARLITLFNGDITDIDTKQRTHQLVSRNKASPCATLPHFWPAWSRCPSGLFLSGGHTATPGAVRGPKKKSPGTV